MNSTIASPTNGSSASVSSSTGTTARSTDRYNYLSPATPAKKATQQRSARWRRASTPIRPGLTEAMQAFRQAHQLDPSLSENEYLMGMAAYEARSYKLALAAWENALAIRPESSDARYGFALTLKAAGYPMDSANELRKLVASHPEEARAHHQPRMRTNGVKEGEKTFTFMFVYATNLTNPTDVHMHQLVIDLKDHDHFTQTWTLSKAGKDVPKVFSFERMK